MCKYNTTVRNFEEQETEGRIPMENQVSSLPSWEWESTGCW